MKSELKYIIIKAFSFKKDSILNQIGQYIKIIFF